MLARRKEREYFDTSPDYGHLATKMGSEYLAKLLSKVLNEKKPLNAKDFIVLVLSFLMVFVVLFLQHLESVIKSRIPSILSLINKSIEELEGELDRMGRPVAVDAGVSLSLPLLSGLPFLSCCGLNLLVSHSLSLRLNYTLYWRCVVHSIRSSKNILMEGKHPA